MAKLQIPIDDDLMLKAKMFALENGTTLKDLVLTAIRNTISNTPTTSTVINSITEENPDILHLLQETQKAIHDSATRSIVIYPKTLQIDIDQSHIENEVVFGNDYVLNAEEKYNSIDKEDLDPEDETEAMILASYEKWGE